MVRRIPKPFTVETRKSGRRPIGSPASVQGDPPSRTLPDDQPRVIWPGLDAAPAPSKDVLQPAALPRAPTGRILPALDQPGLVRAAPDPQSGEKSRTAPAIPPTDHEPFEGSAADQAITAPSASVIEELPAPVAAVARTMAVTLMLRRGRKRLPRERFGLGERWKARLPAVALTAGKVLKKRMRRGHDQSSLQGR